jgi:hypothetical protein
MQKSYVFARIQIKLNSNEKIEAPAVSKTIRGSSRLVMLYPSILLVVYLNLAR